MGKKSESVKGFIHRNVTKYSDHIHPKKAGETLWESHIKDGSYPGRILKKTTPIQNFDKNRCKK